MDIDQQIVGNVDDILNYPVEEGELLTYDSWWNVKTNKFADRVIIPINNTFYKFKSNSFNYIWDDFSLNPEYWQLHYYNKVMFITNIMANKTMSFNKLDEHKANIKYLPNEWVVKYTNEDRQNIELNKMYSKKFNTDYMILGDPHEKIKIIHYLGQEMQNKLDKRFYDKRMTAVSNSKPGDVDTSGWFETLSKDGEERKRS